MFFHPPVYPCLLSAWEEESGPSEDTDISEMVFKED